MAHSIEFSFALFFIFSLLSFVEVEILYTNSESKIGISKDIFRNTISLDLQKLIDNFNGLLLLKYSSLILFVIAALTMLNKFFIYSFIGYLLIGLILLLDFVLIRIIIYKFNTSTMLLTQNLLWLLNPICYFLNKITMKSSSAYLFEKNTMISFFQYFEKNDLQNLIDNQTVSDKVDQEQSEIIGKLIDIRTQRVYEAMTPRTDIVGVEISSSKDEVMNTFIESGYSKLPVFDETLDNIKGWVSTKDIFKQPNDWKSVIREVFFVPETKKSLDMLNEFLERRISLAVIIDEFGGTAGIITLEDLIEEFFGEIRDEYDDVDEKFIKKLNDDSFILSGKVEVDFLNEEYDLSIPNEGNYETIAGYIMFKTGRIPHKSEILNLDNFVIQILKSDKTKIDFAKLTINHTPK